MAVPSLQRSNSLENIPELAPQEASVKSKALQDSSKKTGEAITRSTCGVAQAGVTIGVTAAGHPTIAGLTVTGMKAGEEATVACAKQVIDTGYCDRGLERTRTMTNNCVIL